MKYQIINRGKFNILSKTLLQLPKFEGLTGQIEFDDQGGPVKKMYDLVNFRQRDVVKVRPTAV